MHSSFPPPTGAPHPLPSPGGKPATLTPAPNTPGRTTPGRTTIAGAETQNAPQSASQSASKNAPKNAPKNAYGKAGSDKPPGGAAPIIEARAVTMRFGGVEALTNVTFDVQPGVTGLIGANGAGKTTFMSIALGIQSATSGTVRVLGHDPSQDPVVLRQRVSFVPERNVMPDDWRAVDYVRHLAEVKGIPPKPARMMASDSLWLVGLGEERVRQIGTMSTGQRQRVKLAQALASSPQLILLDEPTAGLDPLQRKNMLALVADIARDFDISIMLSTHLLEEVEQICDQIIALDAGVVLAAGAITTILAHATEGIRIEFAEPVSATVLDSLGREVCAGTDDMHYRVDVKAVDPTLIVSAPSTPEARIVASNACRDVLARHQLAVRAILPNRRSLKDLFDTTSDTNGDSSETS